MSLENFEKWSFPVIKNMPNFDIIDSLVSVQPVGGVDREGLLGFTIVERKPNRPKHALWNPVSFVASPLMTMSGEMSYLSWADLRFIWKGTLGDLASDVADDVAYHREDMPSLAIEAEERVLQWGADLQEGDAIYEFSTNEASWAALAGRAGYAIIRDQKLVAVFLTSLS